MDKKGYSGKRLQGIDRLRGQTSVRSMTSKFLTRMTVDQRPSCQPGKLGGGVSFSGGAAENKASSEDSGRDWKCCAKREGSRVEPKTAEKCTWGQVPSLGNCSQLGL